MSFAYKKTYVVTGFAMSFALAASLGVLPRHAYAEELVAQAHVAAIEQSATPAEAAVATENAVDIEASGESVTPAEDAATIATVEAPAESKDSAEAAAPAEEAPAEDVPAEDTSAKDASADDVEMPPEVDDAAAEEPSAEDGVTDEANEAPATDEANETPATDEVKEAPAAEVADKTSAEPKAEVPSATVKAKETLTFQESTNATDESLALGTVAFTKGGHASHGSYQKNAWQKIFNRYFYHDGSGKLKTGWVVTAKNISTNKTGDNQRYWVDKNKGLLFNQLIDGGNNFYAYATNKGYVARNTSVQIKGIGVVLANNDGRFINNAGWLVSKSFGSGQQRYYLERTGKGYSVAKTGFFTAKLSAKSKEQTFYGNSKGYVSWGHLKLNNGVLVANADGALLENFYSTKNNWLVTKDFDSTIQRYYIILASDGHRYAKVGEFKVNGKSYYGRDDKGYVVRGYYKNPKGKKYYGTDDGYLTKKVGWYQGDDGWYFLYAHGDSAKYGNAVKRAWDKIKSIGSSKPYFICVDKSAFRTIVFQKNSGTWCPIKEWECTHGKPSKETASGMQSIVSKGYYMGDRNQHEYYWSQFNILNWGTGEGQRFHSEIYGRYNDNLVNGTMGIRQSAGCIRLRIANAKWIYDNCAIGTKVYIYW